MRISISTTIEAALDRVWAAWTTPEDIVQWNFASAEWCCPSAEIDLSPGGRFSYRMEAKDGSMGFDFEGTFSEIEQGSSIKFELDDKRQVGISFSQNGTNSVIVEETFEAENEMSVEQQRQGWQSILDNFKRHVEASGT